VRAAHTLAFLLSVIKSGEALTSAEYQQVTHTIDRLHEEAQAQEKRNKMVKCSKCLVDIPIQQAWRTGAKELGTYYCDECAKAISASLRHP
jgi:hypothetical protein